MDVVAVPCLKDNFAYLVIQDGRAAVVDPGEAAPIEQALAREGATLAAIWLTHHHHDHVGGVAALMDAHPGVEAIAHVHDRDRAPRVTRVVEDGDQVMLGELRARIIHNPGHTLGAISYHVSGAVFTGDTLFGAGCGRLFEGTAEQMHASLRKLAALAPETHVYFGHEYTAANLRFAAAAEPDNPAIAARAAALRNPSTPSTIADELATNPFVRARDFAELAARRTWKDRF
jgi:hydroxyacylglutathione hydrolase